MVKSFFNKLFSKFSGTQNSVQIPKAFKEKKRSIFINRYAGLIYFIVVWHTFGYFIASSARNKAQKEGKELHEYLSPGANVKRIELGFDTSSRPTKSEDNKN